jgi:Leu/Phe-tRNA-protein transferase
MGYISETPISKKQKIKQKEVDLIYAMGMFLWTDRKGFWSESSPRSIETGNC